MMSSPHSLSGRGLPVQTPGCDGGRFPSTAQGRQTFPGLLEYIQTRSNLGMRQQLKTQLSATFVAMDNSENLLFFKQTAQESRLLTVHNTRFPLHNE